MTEYQRAFISSDILSIDDELLNSVVVAGKLARAMRTLKIIADMGDTKKEPEDSWRETLFRTIDLAQETIDEIERLTKPLEEADDATPSDS